MTASVDRVAARDGRTLTVRTAGPREGIPIVLLHGQIHAASCWSGIMAGSLAAEHRLIAPDLAGHGGSDPPRPGDADWMTNDLADVLAATDIANPVLVGWSFGSVVACAYLVSSGAARGLVLVGAGTRGVGPSGLDLDQLRALLDASSRSSANASRPLALELFREMLSADAAIADAAVARMIDACRNRPLDPDTRAGLVEEACRIGIDMRAALLTMPYDNADFYAACHLPILQIHGERDVIRPVAAAHERSPLFRNGVTEIWSDSGHAPFDDEPQRFSDRLAAFCPRPA